MDLTIETCLKLAAFFTKELVEAKARLMTIENAGKTIVLTTTAISPEQYDQKQGEQLAACRIIAQAQLVSALKTLDLPEGLVVDLESEAVN